jgi:hypothetical protein
MQANAGTVLFYDDFVFATDTWGDALAASSHTVTTVSSDAAFVTAIGGSTFDLVVTQFDSSSHGTAATALSAHVTGGGKAIFSHWLTEGDSAFEVTQFATNKGTLTLGDFDAGLSGSVQVLTNPTYGTCSRSFTAGAGTTTAATFEDGKAGIVVGNGGRTLMNGFLGETIEFSSDEIQLHMNELDHMFGVPAPGARIGSPDA